MTSRRRLAAVAGSVRVAVIDTGLAGPLADPLLAPARLAAPVVGANPAPDPLWNGSAMSHWVGGHGTHVAGVLAEAAGGAASMLHYEVLSGIGPFVADSRVALAIIQALQEGCRVINLSLSGPAADGYDMIATNTVLARRLGMVGEPGPHATDAVLVAAAGNEATTVRQYPAALDGVIGVGALNADGSPTVFTNSGSWVDCCAVGEDVFGPYISGSGGPLALGPTRRYTGWATWSGTSFATPFVAGKIAAALSGGTISAHVAAASVLAAGVPTAMLGGLGVRVT